RALPHPRREPPRRVSLVLEPVVVGELLAGRAEADDGGDVLDPAAACSLLRAADEELRNAQDEPYEQRGRALGATQLVTGDRAQVGAQITEGHRDVTHRGARIDVNQHASLPSDRAHFGCGLARADLVGG